MRRIFQMIVIAFVAIGPLTMWAQTEYGFREIAVEQDFTENGFNWYRHALLLAAGDEQQSNAMTIGWGGIGTLWRKTAVTVYVAQMRYTKQFMDNSQYFKDDVPKQMYANFPAGLHTMYIGEVVNAWKK